MQGFEVEKDDMLTLWEADGKCKCRSDGCSVFRDNKCASCYAEWCPKAIGGQEWCPNPECKHGIGGLKFKPWVESADKNWIECIFKMWFKTQEILDAHLTAFPHTNR